MVPRPRRTWLTILLVALTACTSLPSGASPSSPAGTPAATGFAAELRADPFGDTGVQRVVDVLAAAGVATYEQPDAADPIVPVEEPAVPLRLLRDQARAIALEAWAGGGIPASLIDEILPAEEDLVPASYIVAGYVAAVDTPSAGVARSLMGEQELTEAPDLVFPQLVLTLFVADVLRDRAADAETSGTRIDYILLAARPGTGMISTRAQADVFSPCAAASDFISGVLTRVFDAIKFKDPDAGGTAVLKTIWNWVVTVLDVVVQTIVRQFTERVLNLIGRAAGIVATISAIVSAVRPWTVTVTPVPWTREKGIAGILPSQEGELVVRVDLGGLDKWPVWIEDCARAAGRPLPNLKPEGTPVVWEPLEQTPPDLVLAATGQDKLDANGSARMAYTTLTDNVTDPYSTLGGTILGRVSLERQSIRDLAKVAGDELLSGLPEEVRTIIWGPILKPALDAAIGKLSKLIAYHSTGGAGVLYHVQEATPEPVTPPPTATPDDKTEFCKRWMALLAWAAQFADTDFELSQPWAAEIARRSQDMRPYAPDHLLDDVDLYIRVYGTYATTPTPFNVPIVGPDAAGIADAFFAMNAYCASATPPPSPTPTAPPTPTPTAPPTPPPPTATPTGTP